MGMSNALKSEIDRLRYETESEASYEDVIWRLLGDRERFHNAIEQLLNERC